MNIEIKQYIDAVTDSRRALLKQLMAIIGEVYPHLPPTKWWGMVSYQKKPGWVALGYRKDGVSLYTCGAHHLIKFKADNPKIKTGVGCINFRIKDQIPVKDVQEVVRHALEEIREEL